MAKGSSIGHQLWVSKILSTWATSTTFIYYSLTMPGSAVLVKTLWQRK